VDVNPVLNRGFTPNIGWGNLYFKSKYALGQTEPYVHASDAYSHTHPTYINDIRLVFFDGSTLQSTLTDNLMCDWAILISDLK